VAGIDIGEAEGDIVNCPSRLDKMGKAVFAGSEPLFATSHVVILFHSQTIADQGEKQEGESW